MLFAFDSGLIKTTPFDPEMAALADRHYTRRKKSIGKRQFSTCTRRIVLRDPAGLVLFVWSWPQEGKRFDQQKGYNCATFRNESSRLSSEIILEAERFAVERWGPNRAYTFIDAKKIRSVNPGYCFKKAGWEKAGKSAGGKIILEKWLA